MTLLVVTCLLIPATFPVARGSDRAAASPGAAEIVLDEPAPSTVYEDLATRLTGRLSTGQSGKKVLIQRRAGQEWKLVATTMTRDEGEFALSLTPVDPGTQILRAVREGRDRELVSATQGLRVLDRRVFLTTAASYETFENIVVSGMIRPKGEGRRIVIQHLTAGRWQPVRGGYTDRDGRYVFSMPNRLPGVWAIRAFWPGGHPTEGTAEYSATHRYTVRAVLDPVVTRVSREELGGSFHEGCPVGPALLRNVELTFRTFAPTVGRGTLVVRSTIVDDVVAAFDQALTSGYPVRRIFPTARYGGSDIQSMYHDNTSAFNCRHVTGDPTRLSPHSYGTALDVDPVENPYQDVHGTWWPRSKGQQFRDRSHPRPGMLYTGSSVTRALTSRGFQWGGGWSHPDYQHFDIGFGKHDRHKPGAHRTGPLTSQAMPAAGVLGEGFVRGDTSGSFVHARRGQDAARGVLPLGCAEHVDRSLPVPRFALQGSYISAGSAVGQAIVMQFRSVFSARAYFAGLLRSLETCVTPDGPSGLAVRPEVVAAASYRGERLYSETELWKERDFRVGARVTVVLSEVP